MSKTGAPLKTPDTSMGILNLEFANTAEKADAVVHAWSTGIHADNITIAKNNTYWDFLFLFFYSGFLFVACRKIAANISGPVAKAGYLIAAGALLAGFLDILENAGMLLTLSGQGSSVIAFATSTVSIIKWTLALIAVLYVLTGLVVLAFKRKH